MSSDLRTSCILRRIYVCVMRLKILIVAYVMIPYILVGGCRVSDVRTVSIFRVRLCEFIGEHRLVKADVSGSLFLLNVGVHVPECTVS